MTLTHEQPTTRSEESGHNFRPPTDARQPADRADAGVDEVEAVRTEQRDRVVDVAMDEGDLGPGTRRERSSLAQGRRGEVEAGQQARAQPGQRDGVRADVALQMDHIQAVQTA